MGNPGGGQGRIARVTTVLALVALAVGSWGADLRRAPRSQGTAASGCATELAPGVGASASRAVVSDRVRIGPSVPGTAGTGREPAASESGVVRPDHVGAPGSRTVIGPSTSLEPTVSARQQATRSTDAQPSVAHGSEMAGPVIIGPLTNTAANKPATASPTGQVVAPMVVGVMAVRPLAAGALDASSTTTGAVGEKPTAPVTGDTKSRGSEAGMGESLNPYSSSALVAESPTVAAPTAGAASSTQVGASPRRLEARRIVSGRNEGAGVPAGSVAAGGMRPEEPLAAGLGALAQGAEGAQALVLTPDEAAAIAVRNSQDLRINAADVRGAEAEVRKTFGLDDFRLSLSATYGRRGPIPTATFPGQGGEPQTVELGSPEINTQQLQLGKPIYSRRIDRAQEVAARSLELQRLTRRVLMRAVDVAARQAVYAVLRAEQLAEVAQQRATAVAAHLDLSKKLRDAGVVAKFEVVQAETELARAQGDVIAARTAVETARAALRRVLNLPQDTRVEVRRGAPVEPPPGDQAALIATAWEARPEVHTGQAAVSLAEASLRLARATSDLTVNLAGGVTRTRASFGSEPTSWQVAVAAELPILDGRAERSAEESAAAKLESAKAELEKTRQQIALEVTQQYLTVQEARERLRVAEQGVVEAEERLRIAKVRYENGIALGIEVLDAETALAAARAEVINSQYSLDLAITELRSSVGLWVGEAGGEPR